MTCPNAYFLKNIYRDKKTGNRLQVASPNLTLGSTVHDAIKWYLQMKGQVTPEQVIGKYRNLWLKYRGKRGGFSSLEEETTFGKRGLKILDNFLKNAGKLEKKTYFLDFPKFLLLEDIVLMGNLDFLGERQDQTLHVLDFKTGAHDEKDPLQLYIYAILAESNLQKPVSLASFWYLDRDDAPRQIVLDPLEPQLEWLREQGRKLKQAITEGKWVCVEGENMCKDCRVYGAIIGGRGEFQFEDGRYRKDIYYLPR